MYLLNVVLRAFEHVVKEISKDLDSGLVQWEWRDGMQLGWRKGIFGAQPDHEPIQE